MQNRCAIVRGFGIGNYGYIKNCGIMILLSSVVV